MPVTVSGMWRGVRKTLAPISRMETNPTTDAKLMASAMLAYCQAVR